MIVTKMLPLLLGALMIAGCTASQNPAGSPPAPAYQWVQDNPPAGDAGAKRFQDTPLGGRTAVESAVELSQKYAQLSDQAATLREENQRLKTDNEKLNQQVTNLDTKLAQTQKELGEANDLLIQTLAELNAWKSNILGFRTEMREAARAELEALLKVLEILGGQVEARALERKYVASLDPGSATAADPNAAPAAPAGGANNGQ